MLNKFVASTAIFLIFSLGSVCATAYGDFEPKMGIGVITNSTLDGLSIKIMPLNRVKLQLGGYYRYREGEPVYYNNGWDIGDGASEGSEARELEEEWEAGVRLFWRAHRFELGTIWKATAYLDSYVGLGYVRSIHYERSREYFCDKPYYPQECYNKLRNTKDSKSNIIEVPLSMELRISWFSINFETGVFYENTKYQVQDTIEKELNYEIGIGTHYYF